MMRINNFLYKYNTYIQVNKVNNSQNVVSFSSAKDDKLLADKYMKDFIKILMLEKDDEEVSKQSFNDLMMALCSEPKSVCDEFFKIDKKNKSCDLFSVATMYDSADICQSIIDLYKNYANDKMKWDFLFRDEPQEARFIDIATGDKTLSIANSMLDLVDSLSLREQSRFWYECYHPLDGTFGIGDALLSCSIQACTKLENLMSQKFEGFKKEYPKFLQMYASRLPKNNTEFINKKNNDSVDDKTLDDVKNSKNLNFRVYRDVKTTFKDVGGMFNVKKQIKNELLNIINNPKVKNSDKPSGIILYGPPGTGKTLLATAIAGEAKLPFVSTNGSSFNEIYVGSGAKRVRELFSEARALARENKHKTAILFIDEADAVASKRTGENNSEKNHTLNALLAEMDGVQSKQEDDINVIVILATNRKDMFDEAFRKGRIDLEFEIDDPRYSAKARKEILDIVAKGKPFKSIQEKNKILKELAQTSSGMSGAELADVIKRAYRKTLYVGRTTEYITEKDINEAKLEILVGIKNDHEFSSDEIRHTMAHEAGHAINAIVMSRVFANEKVKTKLPIRSLDFIVNESRGGLAGATVYKGSQNNHRMTVESLISSLVSTYGGYSIEEKLFDGHTDGVSGDINQCANMVFNAVTKYGLGSKTKYIGCTPDGLTYELFKSDIKQDIIDYTNAAMSISMKIADFVRYFVEDYVERFINEKDASIITGEKFERLFNQWLVDTASTKRFNAFCKEIRDDIANFKSKIQA